MSTDAPPPPSTPPPRSAPVRRFMAAPLVVALVLMVSTGVLVVLAVVGGTADGERVAMRFATCPAAAPIIQARADAIGLGDPMVDTASGDVVLIATLPGIDGEIDSVPALLAATGRLELRSGATVVATDADVTLAQVRLDESGMPYTWVELRDDPLAVVTATVNDDVDGTIEFVMDGVQVASRPNSRDVADGGLRIIEQVEMPSRERMRGAVDRAILLSNGALPCAASVEAVTPLAARDEGG